MTTTNQVEQQGKAHAGKPRALGRGLESLLPSRAAVTEPVSIAAAGEESRGKPFDINVDLIDRNPYQTRANFDEGKLGELAASIAASGVVQPIVVRLGANHKKAGKTTIPAIVREVSNVQAMEMTIVENLQRADLNPMEQAFAYQRLSRDFSMTQEQMAVRTGKDRASVSNFLRLLKLPEAVQRLVESGELSFGHARALLALEAPEVILAASQRVLALNMSVRNTESYVQGLLHPETKEKVTKVVQATDPNVRDAADMLRRRLGLKVTIEDKKGKGKVIIEYSGVEDFDAILAALGDAPSS
jgi:ParB family chromosome partitioning protein